MKFHVYVSKLCYGDVVVEADSEEEAKSIAPDAGIDYYDEEITDMVAERMEKK